MSEVSDLKFYLIGWYWGYMGTSEVRMVCAKDPKQAYNIYRTHVKSGGSPTGDEIPVPDFSTLVYNGDDDMVEKSKGTGFEIRYCGTYPLSLSIDLPTS